MSWLQTELREQPEALVRLIERQAESARTAGRLFRRPDIRDVPIASRGSSSNVACYAQYLLGRAHRVPVVFATPSLYTIYGQPPRLDGGPRAVRPRHRGLLAGAAMRLTSLRGRDLDSPAGLRKVTLTR